MKKSFLDNLSVYKLWLCLILVNIILIGLALSFYNSRFDIINYPFSYAGGVFTQDGLKNTISSRIYSLDMLVSGLIMLLMARVRVKSPKIYEMSLSIIGGVGFIIASLAPDDTRHIFHVIGSAMAVASLWLLAIIQIGKIKDSIGLGKFIVMQVILQVPIFAYAITYFLDIDPLAHQLQKLALLGLITVLLFSANSRFSLKRA